MPNFRSPDFELDFSRNALLIDTNVVYAAFSQNDQRKESAETFLAIWEGDILVTAAVVVETWGMLVGRDRSWDRGFDFLAWIQNPGNRVFLLPQGANTFDNAYLATTQIRVDCVDSFLAQSAHEITGQCAFAPFLNIATYDFSEYLRARKDFNLQFNLINPDTLEIYP